jgi:hypothetical protein
MIQMLVYNSLNLLRSTVLLALVGFRRKKLWVDERYNTTLADDDITQEFVQPDEQTHLNIA